MAAQLVKAIDSEKKHLATLEKRLAKGVVAKLQRCASQLVRQMRVAEFEDFASEQTELPAHLSTELEEAGKAVDAARTALQGLDEARLEELRVATAPPPDEVREAVEAVAVIFGVRSDWAKAQGRLMPSEKVFRERMLAFDKTQVPHAARTRLRKLLSGAAPPPKDALAAALRGWVSALLRYEAASTEAEMTREQQSCTPAMQAGCECLCDLYGMHDVEDDLRGALLMASRFDEAPVSGGAGTATAESESLLAAEDEDDEMLRVQEKANTLKKFVSLMDAGLKEAAKALPELVDAIRGAQMEWQFNDIPPCARRAHTRPEHMLTSA